MAHTIVVPGPRDETSDLAGSPLHTIAGPPVPGTPGYHVLLRGSPLRDVIRRTRPDLIELGSIYLAPWLLRQCTRDRPIPTVGFFHMDLVGAAQRALPSWAPSSLRDGVGRGLAAYLRAAYADCRCVIGPSPTAIASMRTARLPRTALVPFGVDTTRFHPGRRDRSWRCEIGASDARPIVLYVGRFSREKNLTTLMRAVPDLLNRTGATLVCIGDGPLRQQLSRLGQRYDTRLVLLPFEPDRDRLARVYASADVLVAPCEHETFGLTTTEAAASGLPVAGAASGAVGNRLTGEPWGRTFDPHDPAALVTAVADLLRDDRTRLSMAARESAQAYSWERSFERLFEVYQAAVERREGREAG